MVFDVEKLRREFPMLKQTMSGKPLVYLDNAATTFKPQEVIDAMTAYYQQECATVHRAVYELSAMGSEKYASVRRKVSQFLGAKQEEEIIFTRGATESLNIVALCWGRVFLQQGDEIVISEMEHHANIVPWQLLAEEKGCSIKVIPIHEEGILDLEVLQNILSSKTKIVAVSHASNALGTINPIKKIAQMAHAVGAICVVDGAQAVAHFAVDVTDLDCDFYAFSAHKMFGPTGLGVLYGKMELLEIMRPYHGGGDMIREVTFAKTTYQPPPLKFEAGTPMIAQVFGLGAVLDFFKRNPREILEKHENALFKVFMDNLEAMQGVKIFGKSHNRVPLMMFTMDKIHPLDLGTMMGMKGIAMRTGTMCAQPLLNHFGLRFACRISLAAYNTKEEIQTFFRALEELIPLLIN